MILKSQPPLTDDDRMPFGKHQRERMADVPASYFHYLWNQEQFDRNSQVGQYIQRNLAALKKEDQDLIWT